MLHAHKKASIKDIPFFGKGMGTANFIMNNFGNDLTVIEGLLNDTISPTVMKMPKIDVSIKSVNNKLYQFSAINDIIIGGDISD
jgi:NAD kinase